MMDGPNGYDQTALIVTMTTLLLSMMVATMIVMTFVIVMKVAMTIWGSLTYDGGNDLQG